MLPHLIDPDEDPAAQERADTGAYIESKLAKCAVVQSVDADGWDEDNEFLSLSLLYDGTREGLHEKLCDLLEYYEEHIL